jgi:hypothetical protein
LLNTTIWNNEEVMQNTGYSITDIKGCLSDLSEFISKHLSPNRLENFDIEAIKTLKPYSEIPDCIGLIGQ